MKIQRFYLHNINAIVQTCVPSLNINSRYSSFSLLERIILYKYLFGVGWTRTGH